MLARTFLGTCFALAGLLAAGQPARASSRAHEPPAVSIWTNHGGVYRRAARVQVFFRTEVDAYVTVLRVDTNGRVRVLFPPEPGDSNFARGGETYAVPGSDSGDTFVVDDAPGEGYVFAVASQDPFAYDAFTEDDHWSVEAIASLSDGRIHGDPNASLRNLVQQIMPEGYADYDTHLLPYDVEQRRDNSSIAPATLVAARQPARAASRAPQPPGVRIWTNHGEVYQHAERVQVFFRTERDAYVTVLRVDTDGRVRVLFPHEPGDPNLARGGETYTVPGVDDRDAFVVDDAPGVGYVFAVASQDPFDYDAFTANDQWSFQAVASLSDGRVHGDPYASLQDLVQQVMPQGYADYDTHLLPYDVEQQHDYPRFLCYDCHAYTPYASWDPYSAWCPRFSLAVYYNPFYFYPSYWYPTRYYGGTNVVYVRPGLTGRQYVFQTRSDRGAPYTVYRDRRGAGMQQPPDRGVRGMDVGGVGSIPSPGGRRTVGGGIEQGGRRMVGGGTESTLSGPPAQKRLFSGWPQDNGRRAVRDAVPEPITNPRVVGPSAMTPSREDIAPAQPRQRGVYIDPGTRPTSTAGRPEQRENQRYIPQAAPQQESRGTRGYGAPQQSRGATGYVPREAPRSGYAPRGGGPSSSPPAARAAPRAAPAPRSAPALVRRRG